MIRGKIEKIHKLDTKHKTASIIKLMEGKHSDTEVICAALEALGDIADEDSLNEITHYLEHEDPAIRTKACCVLCEIEYGLFKYACPLSDVPGKGS